MTELPSFVLEREFEASPELVWRTWTEPDLLARWYGPNVETKIHKLDVTPGGFWLNEMKMGERSSYQRSEFTEISPHDRLVMLMSTTDADWNIVPNPMMADWPRVLLTEVDLVEVDGKTKMTLTWTPYEATEAEIICFRGAMNGLGQGWNAGLRLLADLITELQEQA